LYSGFKIKIDMDKNLQDVTDIIQQDPNMSVEQKESVLKNLKAVDKELQIVSFKLDRTEKVKRTTAILLEETIEELELKRKAVEKSNLALKKSFEDLEAAQDQLVQQEKLASLGQLTAGIAHEIKNPLNFVNNFSELNIELVEEAKELAGDDEELMEILNDIDNNLKKIYEHGSRADGIVKSMLLHSRGGSGKKELTDVNGVVKEYVNLAFHGMRAGKKAISVDIEKDLEEGSIEIPLIAEDFSRVILNLANNAFDTMRQKKADNPDYKPKLRIKTFSKSDEVVIEVEDNGLGIPENLLDKVFQPFFTTKKGTEGTGLGLSITNDIIKAHGGKMEIDSDKNGTTFIISLPK